MYESRGVSEEVFEGGVVDRAEHRVECLWAESGDGGSEDDDDGGGGAWWWQVTGRSLVGVSRQRNIGNLHQNPDVCVSVSDVLGGAQR